MIVQLANFATTFSLPSQPTDLVAICSMQLRKNSRQLHSCHKANQPFYINLTAVCAGIFNWQVSQNFGLTARRTLWSSVTCSWLQPYQKKMNIIEGSLEVRLPTYGKMERTDREKVRRQREDKRWTRSKREKSDERV